jgi:hypothetical protein
MNAGIRLLIALFAVLVAIPGAALDQHGTVQTGLSSGLLFASNPGGFFSTPVFTEFAVEAVFPAPITIGTGVWIGVAPFLPIDETFGRSLLVFMEIGAGTRFTMAEFTGGGLFADVYAGGGLYRRATEGDRAAGTTRRPTVLIRSVAGMTTSSWEYQIGVVARLLFDQEPVLAATPQLGFRYRFPFGDTR